MPARKTSPAPSPVPEPARKRVAAAEDPDATLTTKAYADLEEKIVTLQLAPGTVVTEPQLSEITGIGRTPVREAIQRLAAQRLVRVLPRRGIVVSEIDVKAQLRVLEVRRELEGLVCRRAARLASADERTQFTQLAKDFLQSAKDGDAQRFMRADRDFNELCLAAARNEFAASAMRLTNPLSRRFWFLHYRQAADLPLTAKLHAALAKAIVAGDEADAQQALGRLLDQMEAFTRATVSTDF